MVVRQLWLGLDYSAAISYRPGIFLLFKFGGVYLCGTHNAFWAEEGKQVSSHKKDEVTDVLCTWV